MGLAPLPEPEGPRARGNPSLLRAGPPAGAAAPGPRRAGGGSRGPCRPLRRIHPRWLRRRQRGGGAGPRHRGRGASPPRGGQGGDGAHQRRRPSRALGRPPLRAVGGGDPGAPRRVEPRFARGTARGEPAAGAVGGGGEARFRARDPAGRDRAPWRRRRALPGGRRLHPPSLRGMDRRAAPPDGASPAERAAPGAPRQPRRERPLSGRLVLGGARLLGDSPGGGDGGRVRTVREAVRPCVRDRARPPRCRGAAAGTGSRWSGTGSTPISSGALRRGSGRCSSPITASSGTSTGGRGRSAPASHRTTSSPAPESRWNCSARRTDRSKGGRGARACRPGRGARGDGRHEGFVRGTRPPHRRPLRTGGNRLGPLRRLGPDRGRVRCRALARLDHPCPARLPVRDPGRS